MKRRRWINLALILAIVVVLAGIAFVALRPQAPEAPKRTATVALATVTSTVTATGTVESAGDIQLSFGSVGTVTSVNVAAGDTVTKGQVLAQIDPTTAQQQVAAAQSTLAQAVSGAATSVSSAANAQQQLALARASAKAGNQALDDAVAQAKANLKVAERTWADACVNPDSTGCTSPSTAEAIRTAQNNQKTAKLSYDKAVELAASNAVTYNLTVNQASVQVQLAKSAASSTCDNAGSTSTACVSANNAVTTAEQQYEKALNARSTGVLADNQLVEKASMALSNADVALRKTIADASKAGSDAVRQARQALTNAQAARDKGRVANAQQVQTAQQALAAAQASVTPVPQGSGAPITPAEASVEAAQGALATAQFALAQTSIIAPVDGTVGAVNLRVGQLSTAAAGTPQVMVIPASAFTARAAFAEVDAAQIAVGDPATVTFQALPGLAVAGTVLSVDPMASTSATDKLVTFTVKVSMTSLPKTVHPGMTASIAITTDEVKGVLAIPQSAITTVGGSSTVDVLQKDNTTVSVPVRLGIKGDALTEIRSGLDAGQVVVIPTGAGTQFPTGGVPGGGPFGRSRG